MASSCGPRTASSSSLSSRRDSRAIFRTSSGVRDMGGSSNRSAAGRRSARAPRLTAAPAGRSQAGRHRERFLLDRALDAAAADALHADAQLLYGAADLTLDRLE